MKYIFVTIISVLCSIPSIAQAAETPPYLRFKTVPPVKLILADSTGWELKSKLDKKKSLMIVIFSPECDHCKHETEELLKNMDAFKNVQIVMASVLPVHKIKEYITKYGLHQYKNITVGHDYAYILPVYYDIKSLPYHAFYTRDKKLISGIEGTMPVEKILHQLGIKP